MKSITLHNLDDELVRKIEEISGKKGISLNKTIKSILRSALGLDSRGKQAEFEDLFGVWSEEEYKEFTRAVDDAGFNKVDPEMWQ